MIPLHTGTDISTILQSRPNSLQLYRRSVSHILSDCKSHGSDIKLVMALGGHIFPNDSAFPPRDPDLDWDLNIGVINSS